MPSIQRGRPFSKRVAVNPFGKSEGERWKLLIGLMVKCPSSARVSVGSPDASDGIIFLGGSVRLVVRGSTVFIGRALCAQIEVEAAAKRQIKIKFFFHL